MKRIKFFSVVSGELFELEEDELKNVDSSQIPLKKWPSSSCKKCYGRFYEGFNTTIKAYLPCSRCLNNCVDFELLKSEEVQVEVPVTTNELELSEKLDDIQLTS